MHQYPLSLTNEYEALLPAEIKAIPVNILIEKAGVGIAIDCDSSILKCYYRPTASLQLNKRNTKYNITVT